jgi:hypothetical protein
MFHVEGCQVKFVAFITVQYNHYFKWLSVLINILIFLKYDSLYKIFVFNVIQMTRPQVAIGGDGLLIMKAAAIVRTADKRLSSSLGFGRGAINSPK